METTQEEKWDHPTLKKIPLKPKQLAQAHCDVSKNAKFNFFLFN